MHGHLCLPWIGLEQSGRQPGALCWRLFHYKRGTCGQGLPKNGSNKDCFGSMANLWGNSINVHFPLISKAMVNLWGSSSNVHFPPISKVILSSDLLLVHSSSLELKGHLGLVGKPKWKLVCLIVSLVDKTSCISCILLHGVACLLDKAAHRFHLRSAMFDLARSRRSDLLCQWTSVLVPNRTS